MLGNRARSSCGSMDGLSGGCWKVVSIPRRDKREPAEGSRSSSTHARSRIRRPVHMLRDGVDRLKGNAGPISSPFSYWSGDPRTGKPAIHEAGPAFIRSSCCISRWLQSASSVTASNATVRSERGTNGFRTIGPRWRIDQGCCDLGGRRGQPDGRGDSLPRGRAVTSAQHLNRFGEGDLLHGGHSGRFERSPEGDFGEVRRFAFKFDRFLVAF